MEITESERDAFEAPPLAVEIAAYKEPAQCELCGRYLDGYADGTVRFCSRSCREGYAEDAAVERAVQRDLARYQP